MVQFSLNSFQVVKFGRLFLKTIFLCAKHLHQLCSMDKKNVAPKDHFDIFKLIYDESVPILSRAAIAGDLELIKKVLSAGKSPQIPDYRGFTSIHSCVAANQIEALKLILKIKAKNKKYLVNLTSWENLTPLFVALSSPAQSLEIVKCLLEAGASPNVCNNVNLSPLHLACLKKGNLELVKLLHEYGADVNIQEELGYFTPLHCAISRARDVEIVQYLVDFSNLGYVNCYGRTPFLEACNTEFMEAVKVFINKDKEIVNIKAHQSSTSLAIATLHGNMDLVKLLLDHGADVNIPSRVYVEACDDDEEVVEINFDEHLPIHSGLKNLDIFKLLLSLTDPKALDLPMEYYSFPVHVLMFSHDTSFIEELLQSDLPEKLKLINCSAIVKFVKAFANMDDLFATRLPFFFKYNFSLEPDLLFQEFYYSLPSEIEDLEDRYKLILKLAQMGISSSGQFSNKFGVIYCLESVIDEHFDPEGIRITCSLLRQPVLTLKQLCRIAVRRHIKSWLQDDWLVVKTVKESGLPSILKRYLFFEIN